MTQTGIKNTLRSFFSKKSPLYLAIGLSILLAIVVIIKNGLGQYHGDTPSYIDAWDDSYSHGVIDLTRPPVYPALIGIGKLLFGSDGMWWLFPIAAQMVVFYLCGILFYRMAFSLISRRWAAWTAVYIYFLFYPIINMFTMLITEPLAFSVMVLWVYSILRFISKPSWGWWTAIVLVTLAEILIRQALLVLPIAIAVVSISGLFMRRYRRTMVLMLLTLLPVGGVCVAYTANIKQRTGVTTMSIVSIYNKYYMARQYNDIFPELLTDNPAAIDVMQRFQKEGDPLSWEYLLKQWHEIGEMESTGAMNYKQMNDYADGVKSNHPDVWYSHVLHRIGDSFISNGPLKNICNYLILTLYTVVFIIVWVKHRRFSLVNWLLLVTTGGSVLSMFLYAQNDFARLMLSSSAILILMAGQLLSCIRRHPTGIETERFLAAEQ